MPSKLIDKMLLTKERSTLVVFYVDGPTISINVKESSLSVEALIGWLSGKEKEGALVHELRGTRKQAA